MKIPVETLSFRQFLYIWNRVHGIKTPRLHRQIAEWLELNWHRESRRLLLMAFRGAGKSTVVGLFCAWLLARNPDLRLLVLAADDALACKMVRHVRRIIERHPATGHLKPSAGGEWAADRFTVVRNSDGRDPSMLAKGILANLTGSRADAILCDDVEVPNTADTAEKRENLRERLRELDFIAVPDGTILYVGTPHSRDSLYAETGFLQDYHRLSLPVLNRRGQSRWPERFSLERLESMRKQGGIHKFTSQMMLQPVDIRQVRLDIALLKPYHGTITSPADRIWRLDDTRLRGAICWWDPSLGQKHQDGSVLALLFHDHHGNAYLHEVLWLNSDKDSPDSAFAQQIDQAIAIIRRYDLPRIDIETNGVGGDLPGQLRTALRREKIACAVVAHHSHQNKTTRILAAFDPFMAQARLYVHSHVLDGRFAQQMQDWHPNRPNCADDALDAVASALALVP